MQQMIGGAIIRAAAPTQIRLLRGMTQTGVAPGAPSVTNALKHLLVASTNLEVRTETLKTLSGLRLAGFATAVKEIAEDKAEPPELRLEAVRALLLEEQTLSVNLFDFVLAQLARRDEPISVLSAGQVLRQAHLTDTQVLQAMRVVRGNGLVPISALLPAWHGVTTGSASEELLAFLSESVRNGAKLRESDLDRMPQQLKTRPQAAELRSLLREETEAARAKLARYEHLLNGGDVERGRLVFRSHGVACAACHAIGQEGGNIGPDLTTIGAIRSGRDILESIVLPSSTFAQGFEPYVAVTRAGDEISGVIVRQSDEAVVMRDASGAEVRLERSSLRELRRQDISLMPEGLDGALTETQFRDLMAFLQSLK